MKCHNQFCLRNARRLVSKVERDAPLARGYERVVRWRDNYDRVVLDLESWYDRGLLSSDSWTALMDRMRDASLLVPSLM